MPRLENIKFEAEIDPSQELTGMEEKVSKKVEDIFRNNVTLESELLNPDDLTLEPEKVAELKTDLSLITVQTKSVVDTLEKLKKGAPDSYDYKMAA